MPATILSPSPDWALFLDVDGTLLPIADTPDGVEKSDSVCRILSRLLARLDGAVALISGRTIDDLDHLFAPLKLPAAGLHGLEHRGADGRIRVLGEAEALDHLRTPLADLAAAHEGLVMEDKGPTLALHYRLAPDQESRIKERVEALVAASPGDRPLVHGKIVVAIKQCHADKGSAVRAFMEEAPFRGRTPVFLGDDVTDEDGFAAVNFVGGVSISVGVAETTVARYQLADVEQVCTWLLRTSTFLASRSEGVKS